MNRTINLFNLEARNPLPEHVISSIAPKPEDLSSDTEKILKALCIAFKKSLGRKDVFDIRCNFESNYSPDEKMVRYGGSIVIQNAQHFTSSILEEFERDCQAAALRLKFLSGYLSELKRKDGHAPGSTHSKSWFESRIHDDQRFAYKVDIELTAAIRNLGILDNSEVELVLFDGSMVKLEIPQNTNLPVRHSETYVRSFEIISASRQACDCETYVDGEKGLVKLEYLPNDAHTVLQAFASIEWVEASVVSVHSQLDGITKIVRFEALEIKGPAKNQTLNLL